MHHSTDHSLSDVHESVDTTRKKGLWRKILAFAGPAYLVSVGYMDPGNWATDLAGGSKFGYTLIWVLLMSNLMAILLQMLSARLGIVRGRDLAQANRETYPPTVNFILYLLAEIAIAATDLAEVLGMAIGLELLTGLPLIYGISITVLDTFLILVLQKLGMRKMEAFILGLILVIGCSLLWELFHSRPDMSQVMRGFVPRLPNLEALYITIGIIGATVMPHNLYLHSALVQTRKIKRDPAGITQALRMNFLDSAVALNLAFFVNAAILVLAASAFFAHGHTEVVDIRDAQRLLAPMIGSTLAPVLFAVALIAAGQSSTVTGTLAGQIVMEGYLNLRISPWLRRLITRLLAIVPAVIVVAAWGESAVGSLLIFSQVLLSLQLGFAVIPLIHFVSDKKTMGRYAISVPVAVMAWAVAAVLVYLNIRLAWGAFSGFFHSGAPWMLRGLATAGALGLVGLLGYVLVFPLVSKKKPMRSARIHPERASLPDLGKITRPEYNRIAMALDFSANDKPIIASALAHGHPGTRYLLIHITESASSRLVGGEADDYESQQDLEQLRTYVRLLGERGVTAEAAQGHAGRRAREIVRIVNDQGADLLVLGGHGHTGIMDWLYGETINYVRHYVNIPVLIVK
jgi:manganese transport protein